jgi:serine phosphatase RsbU (regulator of sigma subunit)
MGRLRTMVRTLAKLRMYPDRLLTHVDELVVEMAQDDPEREDSPPPAVGATCLYALYNPATRQCLIASAGHPPPAIVAPDGSVEFADVPPGAPIGVGLAAYTSTVVELAEGSVLALYTDGLVETRDADIDQGMERLRAALSYPAESLDDLCASVIDTLLPGGPTHDDTALLLARTLPPAASRLHGRPAGTEPGATRR